MVNTRLDGCLFAHYRAPLTLDLIWEVYGQSGAILNPGSKDEWRPKAQKVFDRYWWRCQIGFNYTAPELGLPPDHVVEVEMNLKQAPGLELPSGRKLSFPLFEKEAAEWFKACAGGHGALHVDNAQHMAWVVEKARRVLPVLDVDYAFADHLTPIGKHMGLHPREMMWPLVHFPQEMMDRIGREKFAAAPVHSIEEDPALGDGVWVQVTENPFTATKADLKPAAKHFGLNVPR